jgi:hypothetical protein
VAVLPSPVTLPPGRGVPAVVREVRSRLRRDGGAVLYDRHARTLRKVEAALAADPEVVTHLTEQPDGVRLVVCPAGRAFWWRDRAAAT